METIEIRRRIVRWEMLRLPYNAICLLAAWVAWHFANGFIVGIDELPPSLLSDAGALRDFIFGFAILNVAYCLIYAVEFVGLSFKSDRQARTASIAAFIFGCILGPMIATRGSVGIAQNIASVKRIEHMSQTREQEIRRRVAAEEAPFFVNPKFSEGDSVMLAARKVFPESSQISLLDFWKSADATHEFVVFFAGREIKGGFEKMYWRYLVFVKRKSDRDWSGARVFDLPDNHPEPFKRSLEWLELNGKELKGTN